jgi:endonuclease/exonuclease/phosphatase family metal-dependent hydrolase
MRRFIAPAVPLVAAVLAAMAYAIPATRGQQADRLRVATYNIHKGAGLRNPYNLERTVAAIAAMEADVVGVQEALRNAAEFNCDDQPALIAAGLRRRTGQPWVYVYEKAWLTENRKCIEQGRGDDTASEGLAIFSTRPILSSKSIRLNVGRIGLMVRVEGMSDVPIVVTHLSPNREGQADRVRELAALLPWVASQGPAILMGDLNAREDAVELAPAFARYRDAWPEAAAKGINQGVPTGSTRPTRRVQRIDYVLYSPELNLTLESVNVLDTETVPALGPDISDHYPVSATFHRRPSTASH